MLRLKELREQKNITQADFAKHFSISPSAIGMYEQGRRTPDIATITKFADYYCVTVDYLIGRTDENKLPSAAAPAPAQDALTPSEETHIKKYRQLDDGGKEEIDDLIDVKLAKLQRKAEEGVESLG